MKYRKIKLTVGQHPMADLALTTLQGNRSEF